MNKAVLERSYKFWWYMGGLILVGLSVAYFVVHITKVNGGQVSDIPLYAYFPLALIGIDLYRRLSFYFSYRTDKLTIEKDKLTLHRSGKTKSFKPADLQQIKFDRGFGFIYLKTYGGTTTRLQPWLFGLTLGNLKKRLENYGFVV